MDLSIVGNVEEKEITKLRADIDKLLISYYSTYKIKWEVIKGNEQM